MNSPHRNKQPFFWGAATSAHQVEGNNKHNDWWRWEQKKGRFKSGVACDHYRLFREDFALAKSLGHNAHRLSIEWSRIEPKQGVWDMQEIAHYRAVLEDLRGKQLTPFVTLHHFTSPAWFMDTGGWESPEAADRFARFVKIIAQELGDLVDYWITFNEPNVYAAHGWWFGIWTPQKRKLGAFLKVNRNLVASHKKAYKTLHALCRNPHVGIGQSVIGYYAYRTYHPFDQLSSALANWLWNYMFLDATKRHNDFIGVQYYISRGKKFSFFPPRANNENLDTLPVSDIGWPIDAATFEKELRKMHHRYGLPIYVTENGVADSKDTLRSKFIIDHVQAVKNARDNGADIRGYFYWSLLDNFEWALGYSPHFGLVHVDKNTQKRTPRPSAFVFKDIIEKQL